MGVVWESCQTITWYCWILDNGSKRQKSFNHTLANFQNCTSDLQKLRFRLQKLPKCDWNVVFFAFYCHCPRSSNIKVWSLLVHVWAYITRETWMLCDAILDQTAIKCDRILDQTAIKCDRSFCGVMPLWSHASVGWDLVIHLNLAALEVLQWEEALKCPDLVILQWLAWVLYPLDHTICGSDVFDTLFRRSVPPRMILHPFVPQSVQTPTFFAPLPYCQV